MKKIKIQEAEAIAGRDTQKLHFDVSTGLKRVLGRELITDNEVAIFEMVKNSFDAEARVVQLHFAADSIIVADNGSGMSYDDLLEKWLFVAYSSKRRGAHSRDFRQAASERGYYAGSKGIGRFSSDRLGGELILQTRPRNAPSPVVHELRIDWTRFEMDEKEHFEKVPVSYSQLAEFHLPVDLKSLGKVIKHGTVIEVRKLRQEWDRAALRDLKGSLAKLINPFGSSTDDFSITISVPSELEEDLRLAKEAKTTGEELAGREEIGGA